MRRNASLRAAHIVIMVWGLLSSMASASSVEMIQQRYEQAEPGSLFREIVDVNRVLMDEEADLSARRNLAYWVLNRLLEENGRAVALQYAFDFERMLGELLGRHELLAWRIGVHQDYADLTRMQEDMARMEALGENNLVRRTRPRVSRVRKALNAMHPPSLPLDWDIDAFRVAMEARVSNGATQRAREYVTKLAEVAPMLAPAEPDDPQLHLGAWRVYWRKLDHQKDVIKAAGERQSLSAKRLGLSAREIEKIIRIARAEPDPLAPASRSAQSASLLRLPAMFAASDFQPVAEFRHGGLEYSQEWNTVEDKFQEVLPCRITVTGDEAVYAQNSWTLLRIGDTGALWRAVFPDAFRQTKRWGDEELRWTGPFIPAATESVVAARFIDADGFVLRGMDKETGALLWRQSDNWTLLSNPVVWRDRFCVLARSKGIPATYHLYILNPETGEVEEDLYLFSGETEIAIDGGVAEHMVIHSLPDPTLAGDVLYITTMHGTIFAVNLMKMGFEWARIYDRVPFEASDRLARFAVTRRPLPAVVGDQQVLFAPMDAWNALLVDRATGRLVAEEKEHQWREAVALGGNRMLCLGSDFSARIYSLDDLRVVREWPAGDYRVLRMVSDGAAVGFSNRVLHVNAQGGSRVISEGAEGFRALGVSAGRVYGALSTQPLRLGALTQAEDRWTALKAPAYPMQFFDPKFVPGTDGEWVMDDNALVRLSSQMRPLWRFPFPDNVQPALWVYRDTCYVVTARRIYVLDAATGALKGGFPAHGDPLPFVIAGSARLQEGKLYFAAGLKGEPQQIRVMQDASGATTLIGSLPSNWSPWYPVALFNKGQRLAATVNDHRSLQYFDLNAEQKSYEKSGEAISIKATYRFFSWIPVMLDDTAVIIRRFDAVYRLRADGQVEKVAWGKWPHGDRGWSRKKKLLVIYSSQLIASKSHNVNTDVIHFGTGDNVSLVFPFEEPPALAEGRLYGLAWEDGDTMRLGVVDPEEGKIIKEEVIDDLPRLPRHVGSLTAGGAVRHFIHSSAFTTFRRMEHLMVTQRFSGEITDRQFFPAFGFQQSDLALRNGYMAVITGDRLVSLPEKAFLALTERSPLLIQAKPMPEKDLAYRVDGFPDEWRKTDIARVREHGLAVHLHENILRVLCVVRDQAIIEQVARHGFNSRSRFVVMPGPTASFITDNIAAAGGEFPLSDALPDGAAFDYFIPPEADALYLEFALPASTVLRFNARELVQEDVRTIRGDFALELIMPDTHDMERGLFSGGTIPLFFPRILLPLE